MYVIIMMIGGLLMYQEEYYVIKNKLTELECHLDTINNKLDEIGKEPPAIIVKVINDKPYYYEQWREGDKVVSKSLGAVIPVSVANREREKLNYQELLIEKSDLEYRVIEQKRILESYIRHFGKKSLLDDYVFEVYWKNFLSSRVSVRKNTVKIKRVIVHPLRQIFPSNEITRNRLNEILELRCFDKNRPDASKKLESLGLTVYRPIDIIKKTHGVSYNDYIWFRFMGENICAEDVLVRE